MFCYDILIFNKKIKSSDFDKMHYVSCAMNITSKRYTEHFITYGNSKIV